MLKKNSFALSASRTGARPHVFRAGLIASCAAGLLVDAERGLRAAQWCSERCDWECPDRPRPERCDWWWLQGCLDRQEGAKGLGLSVLKPVHRLDRSSLGQSLLAKRNPIICPSPPQPHISPLAASGLLNFPLPQRGHSQRRLSTASRLGISKPPWPQGREGPGS